MLDKIAKLTESQFHRASQLHRYASLPTKKQSVFDTDGEFMFRRTLRPGCPMTEKQLAEEMSEEWRYFVRNNIQDSSVRNDLKLGSIMPSVEYLKRRMAQMLFVGTN